jgi:CheY-like chemotaxis protein
VAADAAFYSAENEAAAKSRGVKRVCVPNRSTKSVERKREKKKRWFRNGQKWRTGCEGRISVVKRRHGLCCGGASKGKAYTLDLSLGKENGLDLAREICKACNIPIVMLTGKGDAIDRVVGLEVGADDYLAKPLELRELIVRVRAVLRRVQPRWASDHLGTALSFCGLDLRHRSAQPEAERR